MKHGGRDTSLGAFVTAEEAAFAVARLLGPAGVAAALAADEAKALEPAPMTAAEALAVAAAEGLALLRAENATGYKHVSRKEGRSAGSIRKPFIATLWHNGALKGFGYFATAEEAALAIARFLGPAGGAPGRKRPAASGVGPSAPPSKLAKQPANDDEAFSCDA